MALAQPMPLPEPMNASPHHSKVKVSITLADPVFIAGTYVAGKMEIECRADKGLGIGIIMVELFAIQELLSRDHSATSTFLHSKRLFQGPGLPPSNAVHSHPQPGFPVLPPSYYQARRGLSTFLFRIPIPESSPSSINFASGLAKVRYELRASVGVFWKSERRLVNDSNPIEIVAAYPYAELIGMKDPEGVIVGENGKLWMHGKLVGPILISGESACVELQVKNHSNKKNTGLSLSLNRTLLLPGNTGTGKQVLELTDTLTHVPFRGTEYTIPPGAEGIASLVFDVPKHSRGINGGTLDGDDNDPPRITESLFEIRCSVDIKMSMGFGSKDLFLSIPVTVVHPRVVPPQQPAHPFPLPAMSPAAGSYPSPISIPYIYDYSNNAHMALSSPPPPQILPFVVDHHQNRGWLPHPLPTIPPPLTPQPLLPQPYPSPPAVMVDPQDHQWHHNPMAMPSPTFMTVPTTPDYVNRPSSAGGNISVPDVYILPAVQAVPGLPLSSLGDTNYGPHLLAPHNVGSPRSVAGAEPVEGKGQRALRVTQHLRHSSRHRSVSPQSHRFPLPAAPAVTKPVTSTAALPGVRAVNLSLSPSAGQAGTTVHSPRPQLTPKHSFSIDPDTHKVRPTSERVEELERMAVVVALQKEDLSADIPNDEALNAGLPHEAQQAAKDTNGKALMNEGGNVEMNKTLPAPPVPTGKKPSPLSVIRPRVGDLFDEQQHSKSEPLSILSLDRAPPTPTLTAVLPSRYPRSDRNKLLAAEKTESGLDALERRLLAEVGTRKFDDFKNEDAKRPDVRSVIGVGPINIPAKSPEPLNDSAISSLTLANGHHSLDGDENEQEQEHADSDLDGEAKTHRGGRSTNVSGDEGGRGMKRPAFLDIDVDASRNAMGKHRREEADVAQRGPTPTRLSNGSGKSVKSKDRRGSGKRKERMNKQERAKTKTEAKGRVAAWLGGIDPEIPPQEEDIPPSPSVARPAASVFQDIKSSSNEDTSDKDISLDIVSTFAVASVPRSPLEIDTPGEEQNVSSAPNPRSSGFVPIGTLNRDTFKRHPGVEREITVVEEAKKVANIWAGLSRPEDTPIAAVNEASTPKVPATIPQAMLQSIRTDGRVSPPSKAPGGTRGEDSHVLDTPQGNIKTMTRAPSGARNVWQLPEPTATIRAKAAPPPPLPPKNKPTIARPSPRFPEFPPLPARKPDPEVKYDNRSARGGRGGKVAAVTAMWSSVAAGAPPVGGPNSGHKTDLKAKGTPKRLGYNQAIGVPVSSTALPSKPKPRLPGKIALPGLVSPGPSGIHKPAVAFIPNGRRQPVPNRRTTLNHLETTAESGPVPRKLPSATILSPTPVAGPITAARSKSTEPTSTPHTRGLFAGDFTSRSPGKTTPTNLSTPSLAEPQSSHSAAAGGGKLGKRTNAKPMIKSTSVPAVISSSHAVPVLSSTASLARPAASASAPRVTAGIIGVSRGKPTSDRRMVSPAAPKLGLGFDPSVPAPASSNSVASPTKSPPPDLAFGQARLRDLIKKYQGQTN